MEQLNLENIRQRVYKAIYRLALYDAELLSIDVNERAITHQLARYVQDEFEEWNVDCEYNRDQHEVKRLRLGVGPTSTDDTNVQTVYPDIIVHHRGTVDNLLVIEVKKSTNPGSDELDKRKLRAFQEQLCYRFALFLRFNTGRDFQEEQKPMKAWQWL